MPIVFEQQGSIAFVTISNPGKLGAMSRAMWRQLAAGFDRLQREDACRCIVVRGEGGAFCAGGDIAEYPEFRFDARTLHDFHEQDVWGGLRAVLYCDIPVVAQIEGACMGAGMEIASCCDIRIAGESAKFGAPIAKLGFPMAPREAQVVARAAGEQTAREMLLEAAVLDANEMKARRFLNRVLPDAKVADEALRTAQRISELAPQAARLNKRTLRALQSGKAVPYAYDYAPGAEHREGIAAFIEKRKPVF
ncbi:enoyl-CoA hydratase/isomerase family protein [Ramlibacter albus]|uniref:Enoyl-CoA hydratase/isomerase family protein n=1 Tax=Ramlibacter albus TaxID=2079448 RepID=A0A923MCP0_9BURK|nr:enoyl-CoA hydratase/isomerase family protein [Ramlibacter albus]MBC5768327.1 enoyl-CoA hydratase/isomerase family protein [Ramlibacter albus]